MSYIFTKRINPALNIQVLHEALQIALYDEYHARAFYQKVIDFFGPLKPFINIVEAAYSCVATAFLSLWRYYSGGLLVF